MPWWSRPREAARAAVVMSLRNLPATDVFELDFRLADRGVQHRLADAGGGADAKRVEQFEDAALAGVVAHLRDALDLIGALDRGAAVAVGRVAPFDDGGAQAGNVGAHREPERRGAGLGLTGAGIGEGSLGSAVVEQRDHGLRHQDTADVSGSEGRGFRTSDDFRIRNLPAVGGATREPGGVRLLPKRTQLAAYRGRVFDECVHGWQRGGRR